MFNPEKEQHRKVGEDINRQRILSKEPDDVYNQPSVKQEQVEESATEMKLRLLSGVISNIKRLEKELTEFPEEVRARTGQAHQIEELDVLKEQLLSQISPQELEEYLGVPKENTN